MQLVVQLLKRWRDIHYANSGYPPVSIVLTTLAADFYTGEQSISFALLGVLDGIVARLDAAQAQGRRLAVPNPVHLEEDFSERWDSCPGAILHSTTASATSRLFGAKFAKIVVIPASLRRKFLVG